MTDQQTGAWARSVHPLAWTGGALVVVGLLLGGPVHWLGTLVVLAGTVVLAVGIARSVRQAPPLGRRWAYWFLTLGAAWFLASLHLVLPVGMIFGAVVALVAGLFLGLHKPAPVRAR